MVPIVAMLPGVAAASTPSQAGIESSSVPPGSQIALSRAPAGLRSLVERTLVPVQQAELTASDGAANDSFGRSVAISGSTAVVGAEGHQSGRGAAYVFVKSGTAWSQQAELTAADGVTSDLFGSSVAIAGTTVVVGAQGKGAA
jgi:hypothetical protein